jgi:ABC-type Fe3+ transport system permease subunit/DNA-binding beta-propeller fold protein YncE
MNWVLLRNSLVVGLLTTILSVGVGFLAALCVAGLPGRLRTWCFAGAITAFALPPFVVTNCWLHYLGRVGAWHRWLPFDIFSLGGTIWILSMLLWPLSFLLIWGAWQRLEPAQLESDLLVTAGSLVRVLLIPLAREALIVSALLTLTLALNNFAVPSILQVKVLPAEMWIRFNTEFDTPGALRSSYPLFLVPAILLLACFRRDVAWPHIQPPISGRLFRQQLGSVGFCISACSTLVLFFCSVALPVFQILSARRTWSELSGAVAAGQNAISNSLLYSAAAATLIILLGLTGASQISSGLRRSTLPRPSTFGSRLLFSVSWLTFLMPGVLIGILLIHLFNHDWSARFYQSGGIVIFAFVIRYLAIGHFAIGHAARKLDPDLLDVARLEGASRFQLLRHVIAPQISRSVLVSWYLIFVLCLWDVESMILVVPPGGETLALRVFNLLHYGHNAQVNALCLTLLLAALVPLACFRFFDWVRRRHQVRLATLNRAVVSLAGLFMCLFAACAPKATPSLSSHLFASVQLFGSRGVGVGQLNKPRSVAVDNSDNLYVVDMTGRVQKFSSNGVFLLSWQMPQTDRGKPKGMGRDRDGNILVVEPHYSRVNTFSTTGKLLSQWGAHGTNAGQLSLPRGIAVNSHREIFVSEYQEIERVQKFAETSESKPGQMGLAQPPKYLGGFGQAGNAPGEFNRPEGLCVDNQDRVYVADSCNHRIQVFARDGTFLRTYGKAGQGPGELSYPYDICVDEQGRQYVCEFGNSRIQVFDSHDKSIEIIGGPGAEPGRFSNPWGLALDSAGNLYVADSQNHRVQKLIRRR